MSHHECCVVLEIDFKKSYFKIYKLHMEDALNTKSSPGLNCAYPSDPG